MTDLAIRPASVLPDVSTAAAALAHLLAIRPDLAHLPVRWEVDLDGTINPRIEVDHPEGCTATLLLAEALEITPNTSTFRGLDGIERQTLRVEGRWGGTTWCCITYAILDLTGGAA